RSPHRRCTLWGTFRMLARRERSCVAFFSILLRERVMTAVVLSRLKEFQQKGIHDIGPFPHGDVTGIGDEAESRSRDGAVELFAHPWGKYRILLAPENQRRVPN